MCIIKIINKKHMEQKCLKQNEPSSIGIWIVNKFYFCFANVNLIDSHAAGLICGGSKSIFYNFTEQKKQTCELKALWLKSLNKTTTRDKFKLSIVLHFELLWKCPYSDNCLPELKRKLHDNAHLLKFLLGLIRIQTVICAPSKI